MLWHHPPHPPPPPLQLELEQEQEQRLWPLLVPHHHHLHEQQQHVVSVTAAVVAAAVVGKHASTRLKLAKVCGDAAMFDHSALIQPPLSPHSAPWVTLMALWTLAREASLSSSTPSAVQDMQFSMSQLAVRYAQVVAAGVTTMDVSATHLHTHIPTYSLPPPLPLSGLVEGVLVFSIQEELHAYLG